MIELKNVTYRYDKNIIGLRGVSLEIDTGEYIGIIGPNGCGKTTLIRHFNGLLRPESGDVIIDGLETRNSSNLPEIRRRVGMVFQNPDNQIVGMTVAEDLAFGPGNLALPPNEIRKRVDEALSTAGIAHLADREPHTLSGGEKRLVAIAGVLAMRPRYIALDEPTSYLDPRGREKVLAVLQDLHKKGIAIIHITHDLNELVDAERIFVMFRGAIQRTGTPQTVFCAVEEMRSSGLGVPLPVEILYRLRRLGKDVCRRVFRLDDVVAEIASRMNGGFSPAPGLDKNEIFD